MVTLVPVSLKSEMSSIITYTFWFSCSNLILSSDAFNPKGFLSDLYLAALASDSFISKGRIVSVKDGTEQALYDDELKKMSLNGYLSGV